MIKQQLAGVLVLALLLGSALVLAQPAQEVPDGASPQSTNPPAQTSTASQQVPAANGQVKKSAPATTGKDSPFDYRSSEEISEDVPVSFPVDI